MNVFKYLKDSYRQIVFFLLIILITDLVLISSVDLKKSLLDIFYLNILFFFVFLIFLAIDYTKWRNSYKDLKRALECRGKYRQFYTTGKQAGRNINKGYY